YATEYMEAFDVQEFQYFQDSLLELDHILPQLKAQYDNELHLTLKNAYVMPAKLRDIAGEFLETQQKDFKVGFFNSKKKTAKIGTEKVDRLLQRLRETVDSTILCK